MTPPENTLRCLSLTQPWSTLVMIGAKRIETRSWQTSYRGAIGIHASKGFPKDARSYCHDAPFKRALVDAGFTRLSELPLGALLGTVQLVDVVPVERIRASLSADELAFGDYTPGRWAWVFDDVRPFVEPIAMKGALQLWSADARLLKEGEHR